MQAAKIPEIDENKWKPYLAAFAPLPEAFVSHIFTHPGGIRLPLYVKQEPPPLFDQIWQQVQVARQTVSRFLVPTVAAEAKTQRERIVPDWFRRNFEIYTQGGKSPPPTTVQEWINKRLLRSLKHGSLEPNSVAAIYMMRYLFQRTQFRWLPALQEIDDPWFYVWGLMPDETTPRIYPYPLPNDLPANLLLWTQWIGASWQPGWISVPGVGALAWGKMIEYAGNSYWGLTEEEMSAWDAEFVRRNSVKHRQQLLSPIIKNQQQGFPDAEERYRTSRTHKLADALLVQVGEPILAGYMQHYFESEKPPVKPYRPF